MDWETKVRDLRRIINELEMLSQHLEGRHRMLLGRSADELKLFTSELERLLYGEQSAHEEKQLPEWLSVEVQVEAEGESEPSGYDPASYGDDMYDQADR